MRKESWFLTSGIDQGVTKLIAEAVGYKMNTSVIGVTAWTSVNQKELLVQDEDSVRIPRYPVNEVQSKSMISE